MKHMNKHWRRRGLLKTIFATGALGLAFGSRASVSLTSSQTEGPFYPRDDDRFDDIDNDLVKIEQETREAGGEILHLGGQVLSQAGQPMVNARVEIWQCDVNGRYLHHLDRGSNYDRHFQGFGWSATDENGHYTFRTIKPVRYTGRTPHIHFKVFDADGFELLTTQMYVDGESDNGRDFLYQRLSKAAQESLTVALEKDASGEYQGNFDIVLTV